MLVPTADLLEVCGARHADGNAPLDRVPMSQLAPAIASCKCSTVAFIERDCIPNSAPSQIAMLTQAHPNAPLTKAPGFVARVDGTRVRITTTDLLEEVAARYGVGSPRLSARGSRKSITPLTMFTVSCSMTRGMRLCRNDQGEG